MKPTLAITLGDGAGVGPEIVLKLLQKRSLYSLCYPVLIGDYLLLKYWSHKLNLPIPNKLDLLDCAVLNNQKEIQPGKVSSLMGKGALEFVRRGVELALEKKVDGLVTAPLCKEAVQKGGFHSFIGHTEYLAQLSQSKKVSMMFVGGGLKLVLATIHTPLKKVSTLLTKEKIAQALDHAQLAGKLFGFSKPHIAVAGLNPHAGEGGLMGDEEKKVIIPAIKKGQKKGMKITGPYPPDTLFYQARKKGKDKIDVIVVMYHDQGLIPLKMVAFDESVNITLGLPFVRTSPDHGTAFDIAGKGIANPNSLWEAVKVAVQLTHR